jgi:hypothetical protein
MLERFFCLLISFFFSAFAAASADIAAFAGALADIASFAIQVLIGRIMQRCDIDYAEVIISG